MFDCVSIGDATMDVVLTLRDAQIHCKADDQDCEICFKYGEKIPVERMDRAIGGNAMNNVVGLARLGFKTALFSVHGDDEVGKLIDETLDKEGVNRSLVISHPQTQSRYSTIINFKNERTILEYNVPHRYHMPHDFPETEWVYVSSVGKSYEDFLGALASYVGEKNLKAAFNPNNAQLNNPVESYLPFLSRCEIVFMNVEEAAKMLEKSTGLHFGSTQGKPDYRSTANIKKMLAKLNNLGPKVVVITDGKNGSFAYDGEKYYQLGIVEGPVVSATGAGDAYGSGFMGAIMRGQTVAEAMRWGSVNAHSVVAQFGPQTGLLSGEEIEEILNLNPDFQPEKT